MKRLMTAALAFALSFCSAELYATESPIIHFAFTSSADDSGQYTGTPAGGAALRALGDRQVLDLEFDGGYFDFGSSMGKVIGSLDSDFSIVTTVFVPESAQLGQNGNFVFNFGNSSDSGYLFFGANEMRCSITLTNWTGESTVSANRRLPQGRWVNLAMVRRGDKGEIYLDGELLASAPVSIHPSELGMTTQNWLGRSPYGGDVMLKGARYASFSIYNQALADADVASLAAAADLETLNRATDTELINETIEAAAFDFSKVRSDVNLPTRLPNGVTGVWTSSSPDVIAADGHVNRPQAGQTDASLTLTLEASRNEAKAVFTYPACVVALPTEEEALEFDLNSLTLKGNINNLRSSLALPTSVGECSLITWKSSDPTYINNLGQILRLAPKGEGKHAVTLTATARKGQHTATRDFTVYVAEQENLDSYLFVYFPSNDDENLYYAISTDGFKFNPLNGDKTILPSEGVALSGGIRDPHILRGVDGKTFYMVATDMKCSNGWDSNRGIVLYKSTDLVNWTHSTVHFPTRFPQWSAVTHVWAPQVIWDPDYANADGSRGRYMVYFSLLTNDGTLPYDKLYYSYVNDDFTDLLTDPEYLFDRGSATIDADIVLDEASGLYQMIYKADGLGGICKSEAATLTAPEGTKPGSQWKNHTGTLQQTNVAVEGGGLYRLIDSDQWVLMYDCYANGYYQFCATDNFSDFSLRAQTATSGAFTPRHGTVMALTPEETARVMEAFPPTSSLSGITGSRNPAVRQDRVKISGRKITIPVRPSTDLKNFDPMLTLHPGCTATPQGTPDFSAGPVVYNVAKGTGNPRAWQVTVTVEGNPVIPGYHADPEVMFSHKTGRFYIYPTTDGIPGWGGHSITTYSSADLANWQAENVIIDLATDQVIWATGNAWAPCIEEVKQPDGTYKYYFYYSGHNPEFDRKTLGCAVSDSPTGPFYDMGRPIADTNVTGGQLIDSDVFTDPTDGKRYYYWDNGELVATRLADDMVTWTDATVITPQGGSLSDYAFREGVYVFYRKGIYYFLWSVDDTGARNYHVAYGTSTSPMGPITVASDPIVLIQDSANEIYGTGHNSIINVPGTDDWYIVYHRINANYVNSDPGIHREVCIDKLEFNDDGTIVRVKPTHKGIDPVDVSAYMDAWMSGVEDVAVPFDSDADVVSTLYYDFMGRQLGSARPEAPGIYIRCDRLSSGSTRAAKIRL